MVRILQEYTILCWLGLTCKGFKVGAHGTAADRAGIQVDLFDEWIVPKPRPPASLHGNQLRDRALVGGKEEFKLPGVQACRSKLQAINRAVTWVANQ
jgi:hypothetical protein